MLSVGVALAQDPLDTRTRELEAIRAEIAGLQARLDEVRNRRAGLTDELTRLDLELQLVAQRLAEATTARQLLEQRIQTTEARVARLAAAERQASERLRRSLIGLYRLGRGGYLRLALSISSGDDLVHGVRVLRYLSRRDARAFERYLDARAALSVEREELGEQRRRLQSWIGGEHRRRRELEDLRARQAVLLARVEAEQEGLAGRSRALEEHERKLSNLLDFLYGRTTGSLAGEPIQEFRGVLDWPAAGNVVEGFGPRRDPRYQTLVPHNGIAVATSQGAPVNAIYPGEVVFAALFEGYGRMVVVSHPGRVFSVYARLESLEVVQGVVVSFGQRLGRASDRLYFEIREQNRPVDPRIWLR
ncbi:MAG: murein hydrolase activator EnvC family protein [Thermoanaerobaculia bacterium]